MNKGLHVGGEELLKFTLTCEDVREDPELVEACKNHKMAGLMAKLAGQKDRLVLRFGDWNRDYNIEYFTYTYYMNVRVDRVHMKYTDVAPVLAAPKE